MSLVPPHGALNLKPLLLTGEALKDGRARAARLPRILIGAREVGDLVMLGIGGYTPLDGFMAQADWEGVCRDYRLSNRLFWPIPITLSVDVPTARGLAPGREVALIGPRGPEPLAILKVSETYRIDKDLECGAVFRTLDAAHPGVRRVLEQGAVNVAGTLQVLSEAHFPSAFPEVYLTPAETRALFQGRGWSTVAAFQTRNPMHRSHEYLVKLAAEVCDGVLIHSLLGELKRGDIPAVVSVRAIAKLIERYFPRNSVVQGGHPLTMRYAGPREALLHALFRQNYGCSHLIVGRDHAGVGAFYGPHDAQHIFEEIPADALRIKPIRIDHAFWCYRCEGMATERTCPHAEEHHLTVSGTKLREALAEGAEIPAEFSRPEVLEVLRAYYAALSETASLSSDDR